MEFCVFSKHLQAYGYGELGSALRSIGIMGVDLTVRPGGHVEPAEAADKLPQAVEALDAEGVAVTMITTSITSPDEPHAQRVLETAVALGIGFFKIGYLRYDGFGTLERSLAEGNARLKSLGALSKELGIFGGYHNHSGETLGATVAHMNRLLDGVDPDGAGVFFDIAHATMEGALGGWMQGLDDVAGRVRMLAVKDMVIERREGLHDGRVVPMGEGLVQWGEYISCVKVLADKIGLVSIHAEYGELPERVLELAAADLAYLENLLGA